MPELIKRPSLKSPDISAGAKSNLPVILILLAVVAGFMFYFQILKPGQVNEYQVVPELQRDYLHFKSFKTFGFDFSVFDRPDFRDLRTFGEVPVLPSPAGKNNLFSP